MSTNNLDPKKIAAGINYLKSLPHFNHDVDELADNIGISATFIRDCIKEAKMNLELKRKPKYKPKVTLHEPDIIVRHDRLSGNPQKVTEVELEIQKPLIANYSPYNVSEYTVLVPVKVIIKRG